MNSSGNSVTALVPGGVVTTQNISTVIKPKSNNNSLQFVKMQTPELSKTAVEQIRIAEETKISKDKIKEVEEEWQNNLLNWKSKRRQQFGHTFEERPDPFDTNDTSGGRKIKTFAEMIEQRAKSGNRLGFHLQRYIGADDDNEGLVPNSQETKEYQVDQLDHSKNLDSDCENQSSTSSGYNQLDSKSPSSPDMPPEVQINNNNNDPTHICDKLTSKDQRHESESHSISLVESANADQLNSTPKHGIRSPPSIPEMKLSKPSVAPVMKSRDILPMNNEESDNSGFEEDEEEQEEEEQKHLQRIAFEAKLKAFETMTKPPNQKPKFIPPSRTVKTVVATCSKPELIPKESPPQMLPRIDDQRGDLGQRLSNLPQRNLSPRSLPPNNQSQCKQQSNEIRAETQPNSPCNLQPSNSLPNNLQPRNLSQSSLSSGLEEELSDLSQRLSNLPTSDPAPINQVQQCQQSQPNMNPSKSSTVSSCPDALKPANLQQSGLSQNSLLKSNFSSCNIAPNNLPPSALSQCNIAPSSLPPSSLPPRNLPPRNLPPPLPETPKNVPSQRKPIKDEKDRTVLSVSGKKRCSSCKEELGRGAAAFVVESLSLVYHTNCFRCSVCHVNLSNGFRGVDVRVHAGALHCQNCYSKDGLNYSRV